MSTKPEDPGAEAQPKRRSKVLLLAVVAALLLGGGGFYVVYSRLIDLRFLGSGGGQAAHGETAAENGAGDLSEAHHPAAETAFVALDPLVISLGPQSPSRHLKVVLVVETPRDRSAEVDAVRPRIVDMLNVFLRAVDEREFELPQAMERLRAQMLRRVQLVSPEGAVLDLLIQEFLLN